jgi:hypothetical protein
MAAYGAIAAVGQSLLALLREAAPTTEFRGADFHLMSAGELEKPPTLGVTLFLFQVTPSAIRRNLAGRADGGKRRRPPMTLDLRYLLSAWAPTAEKQQRLLGWSLRAIEDAAILPSALLNEHAAPDHDTFHAEETVSLVPEPLALQDLFNVWELAGKPKLPASAGLVARLVAIDSALGDADAEPVRRRDYGSERVVAS